MTRFNSSVVRLIDFDGESILIPHFSFNSSVVRLIVVGHCLFNVDSLGFNYSVVRLIGIFRVLLQPSCKPFQFQCGTIDREMETEGNTC